MQGLLAVLRFLRVPVSGRSEGARAIIGKIILQAGSQRSGVGGGFVRPSRWCRSACPAARRRLSLVAAVLAGIVCWNAAARADGCDSSDPLADVINAICSLTSGGGGGCINRSDTCTQVEPQLFTGVTLNSPSVGNPQWCELGGRGQIMGEAALCLLRDLAQPAQSPSQGGPGITIDNPPISLGPLGNVQVTQRVGFLSFDVPSRVMRGYQDVSFCLPVFGCVSDVTQRFTASLIQGGHGQHCGDYPIDTGHALDILADDNEHSLSTSISPIIIYTPYGPISVQPQFGFGTALKVVTSPYGDPATVTSVRDFYTYAPNSTCGAPRALLSDLPQGAILGAGILVTAGGGQPPGVGDPLDGGKGWDSQVALGGRDADPANPLWMFDPLTKTRPDLDQRQARKVDEKKFVGTASASLPIAYDPSKLLPPALNSFPFHVELSLSVTPAVATDAASQFNLDMTEGSFRRPVPLPPDCHELIDDSTRLLLQSRVESYAAFTITIEFKFFLEINLGLFSKTLIDIDTPITPVNISDKQPQDGPSAGATSSTAPPASPSYGTFTSFSSGAVDGAQFVAACLTEPPPPEQPLPQPAYVPGDPNQLVPLVQYPCNVCVAYDAIDRVCAPKQGFPPDQPCEDIKIACVDNSGQDGCAYQTLATPLPGGTSVLFPAPQPSNKQWLCDSASKLGCYDLCTYDPSSQTPLVVVQSALDVNPNLNCNVQAGGGPCSTATECDDQNPCTDDLCGGLGEFHTCSHTAHDGIACDDGLFCDGTDTCFLGSCSQHSGNPCASGADPGCCDESADACRQNCDSKICGDGIIQFGEQCDDGNTTDGDGCSANCGIEAGFGCIGQPSVCTQLPPTPTPTPTVTPTPTPGARPAPVIPSATAPTGLLLIGMLMWLAYRTTRDRVG